MGDNVVEAQVREIIARFNSEVECVLEKLRADNARLEARVIELERQLCEGRAALQESEALAEYYRRWGQKMYVQLNPFTEEDLEFWRNAKPSDFTLSWDDLREVFDEAQGE